MGIPLKHSFAARRLLHDNNFERLHPESYRQLRELAKLHGAVTLERALQHIANDLSNLTAEDL